MITKKYLLLLCFISSSFAVFSQNTIEDKKTPETGNTKYVVTKNYHNYITVVPIEEEVKTEKSNSTLNQTEQSENKPITIDLTEPTRIINPENE